MGRFKAYNDTVEAILAKWGRALFSNEPQVYGLKGKMTKEQYIASLPKDDRPVIPFDEEKAEQLTQKILVGLMVGLVAIAIHVNPTVVPLVLILFALVAGVPLYLYWCYVAGKKETTDADL